MRLARTAIRRLLSFAAVAQLVAFPLVASAAPSADDGEASAADAAKTTDVESNAPATSSRKPGVFSRVADDEETIYAIQRKAFLVDEKFEFSLMLGLTFTDRFVQSYGLPAASIAHHLAENFAIELYGAYVLPVESELTTEILDKRDLRPEVAKLTQMLWGVGLGAQWSPIYGKLQVLGFALGNFNFYVGAGGGIGQTRAVCHRDGELLDDNRGWDPPVCPSPDSADPKARVYEPTTTRFMGALSVGARFYFSNMWGLRLEFRDYIFPARVYRPEAGGDTKSTDEQRLTDAIRNNLFVQLGVSVLLGGEQN